MDGGCLFLGLGEGEGRGRGLEGGSERREWRRGKGRRKELDEQR